MDLTKNKAKQALPQTGDKATSTTGLGLAAAALGLLGFAKKKKDDQQKD
ncbi:LPXTG cell wall anchor domain-containing protein [Ligilactobacillus equi]